MQERSDAERCAHWPCLNASTWQRERSDLAIQQVSYFLQEIKVSNTLAVTALKASETVGLAVSPLYYTLLYHTIS